MCKIIINFTFFQYRNVTFSMKLGDNQYSDKNNEPPLIPNRILEGFSPVNLTELESYGLLDRFDNKYALTFEQLMLLLPQLSEDYSILEIKSKRIFLYDNFYFDTDDLKFYFEHHNGKLNRYKIRYRRYVDSDIIYFEMKKKDNKNKTLKKDF